MSKMAELDISIKESFIEKIKKVMAAKKWSDDSQEFDDALEEIYDLGPVTKSSQLARYSNNIWVNSNCNSPTDIFNIVVKCFSEACEDNYFFGFQN